MILDHQMKQSGGQPQRGHFVSLNSLAQFFQQWVYQGGYPAFEVHYSWDSEHTMVKLNIKQTQKVDDLTPCFVTPIDLAFTVPTSDEAAKDEHTPETRTVRMRVISGEDGQVEQSFYVSLEREPLMIRFDPDGHVLEFAQEIPRQGVRGSKG